MKIGHKLMAQFIKVKKLDHLEIFPLGHFAKTKLATGGNGLIMNKKNFG